MPTMLVRNISEEAHNALKQRAKERGTSAEAEMRALVEGLLGTQNTIGFGTKIHNLFRQHGVNLPEIVRDKTPSEPAIFE